MKTTNIQSVVNYDRYSADKYDRDIINAIPHHKELHEEMVNMLKIILIETKICSFDLGGHGITNEIIKMHCRDWSLILLIS